MVWGRENPVGKYKNKLQRMHVNLAGQIGVYQVLVQDLAEENVSKVIEFLRETYYVSIWPHRSGCTRFWDRFWCIELSKCSLKYEPSLLTKQASLGWDKRTHPNGGEDSRLILDE